MDDFRYRVDSEQGVLECEDVCLDQLADDVGTPAYVYSQATLEGHFDRLAEAFAALDPLICFSVKSCSNTAVCRVLTQRGGGLDLVSGGELYRALKAGVDPSKCVYAGVGKRSDEIIAAIEAGIGWLNVESGQECALIGKLAEQVGRPCHAALRVNPDVQTDTHHHTATGHRGTKFGVQLDQVEEFFRRYGSSKWCKLCGIHLHIGSPILEVEPYVTAVKKGLALMDRLESLGYTIDMFDLGGGFGADYESGQAPEASVYAEAIVPLLESRVAQGLQVVLEPGRSIAANAGVLLLTVLYVKESDGQMFLICDGGMNVILRPALYDAFHFVWPTRVHKSQIPPVRSKEVLVEGLSPVSVVGPICETGDIIAKNRALPPVKPGDRLAVFGSGAYGMSMASQYNSQPLPPEVLVMGEEATVIRRRETYADLVAMET